MSLSRKKHSERAPTARIRRSLVRLQILGLARGGRHRAQRPLVTLGGFSDLPDGNLKAFSQLNSHFYRCLLGGTPPSPSRLVFAFFPLFSPPCPLRGAGGDGPWEDRGVRLREAETGPPSLPLPFFALAALGGDFPPGTGESWLLSFRWGSFHCQPRGGQPGPLRTGKNPVLARNPVFSGF